MPVRRLLLAVLAALGVAVAGHAPPVRAQAVTYQANAQHDGFVPEKIAPSARRRWLAKLDPRVGYPVVAGDRVFVASAPMDPLRGGVRVVALSLASGRRLWQRELGGTAESIYSAALGTDGERLYVTRDVYGEPQPGALIALSLADGHTVWQTADLALFDAEVPVVDDGVVYLSETSGSGGISAWRASDGTLAWRTSTDHGGGGAVALTADTAYLGVGCEPHVFRVRRTDGAPLVPTSSGCSSGVGITPVIAGQRLFLRGDDLEGVYDLAGTKTATFRSDYSPAVAGGLTVVADALIPGESAWRGHTLKALDARGRTRWRFRGDGYLDSAPLIAGRTVYVGSGAGHMYGVDLRSGRLRWRGNAGTSVFASRDNSLPTGLAVAGKTLLVPARGRLVAFR
jgi:outer membrane protein assembly factor BamB